MDFGTIVALVIAGLGFLYTIFRDSSSDTEDLLTRVSQIEAKIQLHSSSIDRLETEQDEMKKTLRNLEDQIHQLDLKIERILTILEKTKGA
ncbi:hypothetical protein AB687_000481 [Escherichia coli]|jgi:peptidoglycan hydrolase CwlO-like protein|uniref:hypothetical protein n=1 Tax=Enterobacteriaceae TaxID=543 RepID=UPI0006A1A827|nr:MULTISPECIES: hypothetical protein [Enterobacteriaceae]HDU4320130.1 hypothetical protein [Klebsiella aerogenes]AUK16567.1 hypothetical protein CR535_11415 [Escherichia coli]EEV5849459.1 hypothetical protein [Escherichia coli]EEV6090143.1 hypothetical protein [Escherichia coli]EEV7368948.1 hypothetical protein [Escherichia coli]